MGPYRDEENFLPFQTNYEFLCRGCNYPEWTERFRLTKSSWVQSVLSAQASLMHRYQRYCFKVAEVKQFVDEHWDLICVDEDKDGQPFPKDRRRLCTHVASQWPSVGGQQSRKLQQSDGEK